MIKKIVLLTLILLGPHQVIFAQPHLHIERNLESVRIDGNQSWLSFWDGPAYKGFLWNNQGNMTLGTSDENTNGQLKFITNQGERMTINSLGRIGVNTSNPLSLMHIQGDNDVLRLSGGQPYISYYNGIGGYVGYLWNKNLFDFELGTASNNSTGSLFLRTRGNLGIWIDPDGDVGIGAAPAGAKLDVDGEIEVNSKVRLGGIQDNNWTIKNDDGAVNFGSCSSPNDRYLLFDCNGIRSASIRCCDGDYLSLSDRRYKENIKDWGTEGVLSDVLALHPVSYDFIHSGFNSFGLIAQDVYDHFPQIVDISEDKDGQELFRLSYSKLSIIAIKAIQEQQEIIDEQKLKINQLESQLIEVQKSISALLKNESGQPTPGSEK